MTPEVFDDLVKPLFKEAKQKAEGLDKNMRIFVVMDLRSRQFNSVLKHKDYAFSGDYHILTVFRPWTLKKEKLKIGLLQQYYDEDTIRTYIIEDSLKNYNQIVCMFRWRLDH